MKELDIKLGYNCNNHCVFCLNKEKRGFSHKTDDLKRQIQASARKGCEKLIISGGEPLIYPNFFEILSYAKNCGIKYCEIQTNGRALSYEDFVRRIKDIFPEARFLISFHYPNEEMYKKYSQTAGFFQVLKGFDHLNKFNLGFTTNTVLFKGNLDFLLEIADLLDKKSCSNIQFRFIDGRNLHNCFYDFVPRMEEAVLKLREVIKRYPDKKIYIHEIPLCVLGEDLMKYNSIPTNTERENMNMDKSVLSSPEIMEKQFVFPACDKCFYKEKCKGVRENYIAMFDEKEINSIIKQ